jgi:hypothetical protein
MKIIELKPARQFKVGRSGQIVLNDCGRILLGNDEQVTFCTDSGHEYDVVRKSFGYYATPSINSRLARFGYSTALVKNKSGHFFVLLVEKGREDCLRQYLRSEELRLICKLNDPDDLAHIEKAFENREHQI